MAGSPLGNSVHSLWIQLLLLKPVAAQEFLFGDQGERENSGKIQDLSYLVYVSVGIRMWGDN